MGQGRIEGRADVIPPTSELTGFGIGSFLVLVGCGTLMGTAEVTLETIELTGFGAGFAEVVGTAAGAFVFEPIAAGALVVAVAFGAPAWCLRGCPDLCLVALPLWCLPF
jgi:hypothetical protein